jgi:hypothetical protein
LDQFLAEYKALSIKGRGGSKYPFLMARSSVQCILDGVIRGLTFEGIEGFVIFDDGSVQPSQELSVDRADWLDPRTFSAKVTAIVLDATQKRNVAFEVVFSD